RACQPRARVNRCGENPPRGGYGPVRGEEQRAQLHPPLRSTNPPQRRRERRAGHFSVLRFSAVTMRGLRWWIISLIFLATFINFLDRLTIAVQAQTITEQLRLTNLEFASISTWFLLA